MSNEEGRKTQIEAIAAEVSWLRQEVAQDNSLRFLNYLLGMAEQEAARIARNTPKDGASDAPICAIC